MWQNKKFRWATAGAATLGLSYLIYLLLRSPPGTPRSNPRKHSAQSQQEQHLRTVHSNFSEFYFDKEEQLRAVISRISPKGPTVEDVYLLSPLIIVDQFLRYTREIRKRRRLIRKVNQDQYVNLIRSYEVDVKEVLEAGREEVLREYGLSLDDLQKMQEAYQMFQDLQKLRKRAGEQLRARAFSGSNLRRIPRDKLRKIIEQEIFFISNRMYDKLKNHLQEEDLGLTQEEIYKVITTLCDDILFEKFGYEREEIENQLSEVPLLARDLQKQRQILQANLVEFKFSLESSDEQEEPKSQPHASGVGTADSGEHNTSI